MGKTDSVYSLVVVGPVLSEIELGKIIRVLVRLIQFILFLLLLPLIFSFCVQAFSTLTENRVSSSLSLLLIGLVSYIILYLGIQKTKSILWNNHEFIRVLRHELAHAIIAILLGARVKEMTVSNMTGQVKTNRMIISGSIIALAPYCFPIFTFPFLLLKLLPLDSYRVVDFFIGFTLTFHFVSMIRETSIPQPDIDSMGCFLSYSLILLTNLLLLVLILSILDDSWLIIDDYIKNSIARSSVNYQISMSKVKELAEQLINKYYHPTPR